MISLSVQQLGCLPCLWPTWFLALHMVLHALLEVQSQEEGLSTEWVWHSLFPHSVSIANSQIFHKAYKLIWNWVRIYLWLSNVYKQVEWTKFSKVSSLFFTLAMTGLSPPDLELEGTLARRVHYQTSGVP